MGNFNQTEYNNKFIKDNYDRINFTAPKGYKEKIQKRAEELGFSKSGPYIKSLIDADLTRSAGGGL